MKPRYLSILLLFFSIPSWAISTFNPARICQRLLTSPSGDERQNILDVYRDLISNAGADLVSEQDLRRMIATKAYFDLGDSGSSMRDHLAAALRDLGEFVANGKARADLDRSIEAILHNELEQRFGDDRRRSEEQARRANIAPEVRKFQSQMIQGKLELALLSPDQRTLVEVRSGVDILFPQDQLLFAWDVESGTRVAINYETYSIGESFAFARYRVSADSKTLLLIKEDGIAYEFDLNQRLLKRPSAFPEPKAHPQNTISLSPDRNFGIEWRTSLSFELLRSTSVLTFVDFSSGFRKDFEVVKAPKADGASIKFASDSSFFVVAPFTFDGGPSEWGIWNTNPLQFRGRCTDHSGKNLTFYLPPMISPDNRYLAGQGQVFSTKDGSFLFKTGDDLQILGFSADSRWIATANHITNAVSIFDMRDGSLRETFPSYLPTPSTAVFTRDNRFLIYRAVNTHWYVRELRE